MNTGESLKQDGQQLALFNQGDKWRQKTIELFGEFSLVRKAFRRPFFKLEDFRHYAISHGLENPTTDNAWGSVPRTLAKKGLIESTDKYVKSMHPAAHARIVRLWRIK